MSTLNLPLFSYPQRSIPAGSPRLVNCYAEASPVHAPTPIKVVRAPGIDNWTTVGSGPIRGLFSRAIEFDSGRENNLYVVSGSELYKVDEDKNSTLLGDVGSATGVDMSSNTTALVVVNEPLAYYYDGVTFGQIVDDDFVSRGAGDVEFLDDFMLFREPDSARFFASDIGSVTDYDALQFGIADASPDELVGMIVDHRRALLFGVETTEMWENTGIAGFPFERNINGTIEVGAIANTIVRVFDQVFFVADDLTVRRLEGIAPFRVSNHAIELRLGKENILSAMNYELEGHFFYVLTTDVAAYAYDVITEEWSERATFLEDNWSPRYYAAFNKLRLVGDWRSNKIGVFDADVFTEFGTTQVMEWTYQPIYADGQRAFHDRFEIRLETGVGLTTGQGADPKIMLKYSDDGGKTFTAMPDRDLGKLGNSDTRAIWHNLGSSRQRVYKASVSDPIKVVITDTITEVRGGRL